MNRIGWGVRHGLFMAGWFSLIALAVAFFFRADLRGGEDVVAFVRVIGVYGALGVVCGGAVGAMRPLARTASGAAAVGAVAGSPIYIAFGLAFGVPVFRYFSVILVLGGMGALFGAVAGVGLRKWFG